MDYSIKKEPYHYYFGVRGFYHMEDKMYDWVMDHRDGCSWIGDIIKFTDEETLIMFKLTFGV